MTIKHPSQKPKTVFLDLDGTIVRQHFTDREYPLTLGDIEHSELLPGVREKITAWSYGGVYIVITTARKETYREETVEELKYHKIVYDQLVMGLPTGQRILINDAKPEDKDYPMAVSATIDRDSDGLGRVKLDSEMDSKLAVNSYDLLVTKDRNF